MTRMRKERAFAVAGAALLVAAVLWGGWRLADPARSAPDKAPLRVVASLGIFADMAAEVGGDATAVTALVPAEADPHAWDPSIREMRALAEADVFIYNGLGLEPWAPRALEAVAPPDLVVVRLTDGLLPLGDARFQVEASGPRSDGEVDGGEGTRGDPHMWLDVTRGIAYVRRIEAAFAAAAPWAARDVEARAAAYAAELERLDEWLQSQVDAIPPERRVLITDHDAYVYMADRYGLTRAGYVTANPDREPAPREMARLTALIRETGAPALFAEPHVGTHFIDELARETGVPVGVLYTDAFFGDVGTYVDMMRANGEALRAFLGQ